jgi:hypothetical protein
MRRWLLLLFAVLLPMQLAWGAASAYCQHESAPPGASVPASHIGHHVHEHEGDREQAPAGKLAVDTDCATCHATGTPAIEPGTLWGALTLQPIGAGGLSPASAFSSALARAPDRPQWPRLAGRRDA